MMCDVLPIQLRVLELPLNNSFSKIYIAAAHS